MSNQTDSRLRVFIRHSYRFGIIGVVCFLVDLAIYNGLRTDFFGEGHALQGPIEAKVVSGVVSTLLAWVGNRFWTFHDRRRPNFWSELLEFGIVAGIGTAIGALCLWISHYVLGFQTLLADNISGNVIGLGLATAFRFFVYRHWVFGLSRAEKRRIHNELQIEPEPAQERSPD